MSGQFKLAVGALFTLYCMNELIRLATPIALKALKGSSDVAGEAGLAFSIGGLVSAISVIFVAPRLFGGRPAGRRLGLVCRYCGSAGFLLVGLASGVSVYILGFLCIFLVFSAMVPALNTLIAANTTRSRRGTAFGVAATFQAGAFAVGPPGRRLLRRRLARPRLFRACRAVPRSRLRPVQLRTGATAALGLASQSPRLGVGGVLAHVDAALPGALQRVVDVHASCGRSSRPRTRRPRRPAAGRGPRGWCRRR